SLRSLRRQLRNSATPKIQANGPHAQNSKGAQNSQGPYPTLPRPNGHDAQEANRRRLRFCRSAIGSWELGVGSWEFLGVGPLSLAFGSCGVGELRAKGGRDGAGPRRGPAETSAKSGMPAGVQAVGSARPGAVQAAGCRQDDSLAMLHTYEGVVPCCSVYGSRVPTKMKVLSFSQ